MTVEEQLTVCKGLLNDILASHAHPDIKQMIRKKMCIINPANMVDHTTVIEAACMAWNTTEKDIKKLRRITAEKYARQFVMHFLITNELASATKCAQMFGLISHATAIHAKKNINNMLFTKDKLVSDKWNLFITNLNL